MTESFAADQLTVEAAVISYDKHHTPHYIRNNGGVPGPETVNQDYGLFVPDVGLLVSDGVGGTEGGAIASRTVVHAIADRAGQLRMSAMPPDEADDAVRSDILPYVDDQVARAQEQHRLETASATLGALLISRTHLVAIGIGDTVVFGYAEQEIDGQVARWFGNITSEQGSRNEVYNTIGGRRRPTDGVTDEVRVFPMAAKQRFLIATDGLLGDEPGERLPELNGHNLLEYNLLLGDDPWEIAERLTRIPVRLDEEDVRVPVYERGQELRLYYIPKDDDMTVGTMLVRSR